MPAVTLADPVRLGGQVERPARGSGLQETEGALVVAVHVARLGQMRHVFGLLVERGLETDAAAQALAVDAGGQVERIEREIGAGRVARGPERGETRTQ